MALPFYPQAKPRHRHLDTIDDARTVAKHKREVYAEVDERDGRRCRCCGRKGNPHAVGVLGKIHRCHIHDAGTLGPMSARNLCSLCSTCAALETAKQLFFVGTNANRPMKFEVMDAAVEEIFGDRELPPHVRIITLRPRQRYGA